MTILVLEREAVMRLLAAIAVTVSPERRAVFEEVRSINTAPEDPSLPGW